MNYTTRLGDRATLAHVNYACPCGCVAGLTFDRAAGSEHLGACCCGRLLWVGDDAAARLLSGFEAGVRYVIELDRLSLPWGASAVAALATPSGQLVPAHDVQAAETASALFRDVVCGMRIDPLTAAGISEYRGVVYYFCAAICKQRFDSDPERYLAHPA